MVFRRLLSSLGINAPEVETVLVNTRVRPGERLTADVTVRGGGADVKVERLVVDLQVLFEGHDANETRYHKTLWRKELGGGFTLRAGETRTESVRFDLPWEMPLTHAGGFRLRGPSCAVVTELAIDDMVDRGDHDPVEVHALPAQDAVLQAMGTLGFRYDEAEVKPGRAMGADQAVDWWQEIELRFPAGYGREVVELQFVARESELDVHLGALPVLTFPHDVGSDQQALTSTLDAFVRQHWGTGGR
jgi:sporulation-control protein